MTTRTKKVAVPAKAKTKATPNKSEPIFDYGAVLDEMDSKFRLVSGYAASIERMHTGSYVVDLLIGGGYYPGRWYTTQGKEASGKTTLVMKGADSALSIPIPIIDWWDYEGAMDLAYFGQMMKHPMGAEELFGTKDKNSKVLTRGLIRYHDPDVAEIFFDVTSAMLRRLPDKRYIKERQQWFLIFDAKEKKYKSMADKHLSKDGLLYVPTDNGNPQGMLFIDSYPAMLPERQNVDDPGSAMAAKARMFAENLDRVRPKLRRKAVNVLGVNQLRLRPGVTFGNPEYAPGGEALKFAADCRLNMRAVSVPKIYRGEGKIVSEKSVLLPGDDHYRYIKLDVEKNKVGPNFRTGYIRVWMEDPKGKGHGFDPVHDVYEYLRLTGQVVGNMKTMEVRIKGKDPFTLSWIDLKKLVLTKGKELQELHKKLGIRSRIDFDKIFREQLTSDVASAMYSATRDIASNKKAEKDKEKSKED